MSSLPEGSISYGREYTGTLPISETQEWLITNGIGGYGSGTVSGVLTRRYHGLLVAALDPPVDRTLLLTKIDEEVIYDKKEYFLSANRWANQTVSPLGYVNIENFHLEGTVPVWNFACSDALIEKRVWMEQGENTTYVKYTVLRASLPVKIILKAIVNFRGYHNLVQAGNWRMQITPLKQGLKTQAFKDAVPFYLLSDRGQVSLMNEWYYGYYLTEEAFRGLDCEEDHLFAGAFQETLMQGESITIVATTNPSVNVNGNEALQRRIDYETNLIKASTINRIQTPTWINQLVLAADQFVVDRPMENVSDGKTIIAGYHWFTDWGRDTMISLPGLTLVTGRHAIAKTILQTFSKYVHEGMLPNQFPDQGQEPQYNTVDAALWYIDAVRAYYESTQDIGFVEELFPVLESILDWYQKGTRYQIHADADGLLYAGQEGVQLTWMDAKVGSWVVTPRIGKAIEVNALWYNAHRVMAQFAQLLGKSNGQYGAAGDKISAAFIRFWNDKQGFCFDVIDGPNGNDASLRPNQLLAISLPHSPLSADLQKLVVDSCIKKLLTTHGMRSLSPDDPSYKGFYGGNQLQRDSVYHQGTVWAWLLGPFCKAHLKVYCNPKILTDLLSSFSFHLKAAGLGSCSEIFDGDAPMSPRGCISQAWSVGQILETWKKLNDKIE